MIHQVLLRLLDTVQSCNVLLILFLRGHILLWQFNKGVSSDQNLILVKRDVKLLDDGVDRISQLLHVHWYRAYE